MSARARVLATAALLAVCATSGTVGGAQAARLVTGADIVDGSLTGRDVRDESLGTADVRDGGLTPADFPFVRRGPQGPAGEAGPRGLPGLDRLHFEGDFGTVLPGKTVAAEATCTAGHVAVAGGVRTLPGGPLELLDSAPLGVTGDERRTWVARARNPHSSPADYQLWVLCAVVRS